MLEPIRKRIKMEWTVPSIKSLVFVPEFIFHGTVICGILLDTA